MTIKKKFLTLMILLSIVMITGGGFAVVADEVRTLAYKTAESTSEIESKIENFREGTTKAVEVMGDGIEKIEISHSKAEQAVSSLNEINESVHKISEMNQIISIDSEKQNTLTDKATEKVLIIKDVFDETEENLNNVVVSSNSSINLSKNLNTKIKDFKV